ncbi:transcription initiation factor TFIID subunit 3 [Protopterus annectens]|uniref:transcription initiation factor TFIID subunit 3 n=1 Tax=Protopterus annectens TaxID=7888 RepID=UPI001CFBC108|nr:transcription initiation factor TFIID subunit 3 [Protopterus annectens]
MCESYARSLLRISVAQICQALGWDSVHLTACDLLTDVLQRYIEQQARFCHRYSELYGRTDTVLDDVDQAFSLMGVNLHELEDYIHNIEPVTFAHQIPVFPVSKNNVLQFPQLGTKDVVERKEYIPEYMPPLVSFQEEEEEEQVPTHGGTSAEAMQVPLEEEAEMEEEEDVNDENLLGKRPLPSPESVEIPPMKRPRLPSNKGENLDGTVEPREPLSSINPQKLPPMLSPVHVQDNRDSLPPPPEPPMLAPMSKAQVSTPKASDPKVLTTKTKPKVSSPLQKVKSPKGCQLSILPGSPIRSPKPSPKEKKSPGRTKSPKSPRSPKVQPLPQTLPPPQLQPSLQSVPQPQPQPQPQASQFVAKAETPVRTPLSVLSEKMEKEILQAKQGQGVSDSEKLIIDNHLKKPPQTDKTIDDSINAVIARACAEQEPDPFEFSSGTESEDESIMSPRRRTISESSASKIALNSSCHSKSVGTPFVLSGGTSSSDISWTMDDSINEVIRKVNMNAPSNMPINPPYFSSPSASPPTPEPLLKIYEEKTKLASSEDVKKKLKKELKTKIKKKEKEKQKDRDKEQRKEKNRDKDKNKDKDSSKELKLPWKDSLKEEEHDPFKFKYKDFDGVDVKTKTKDGSSKKDKEKHKDKKKDKEKGKKDKEKKDKEKIRLKEEKLKPPATPLMIPPQEMSFPSFSTPSSVRLPTLLPALSPMLPEKLFEEKEKPKDKEKKKDKKEKKKKKEKDKDKNKDKEKTKDKEKEKREKDKEKKEKEKDKEKHKHEKVKVEPKVDLPPPSPASSVIPRLTLRVGAGQDKIVISKVVQTPDGKPPPTPAPVPLPPTPVNRPKSPLPPPSPAPVLMLTAPRTPAPAPPPTAPPPSPLPPPPAVILPPLPVVASPAPVPPPSPAPSAAAAPKASVCSVVTETVKSYVIEDDLGNRIWICPGCEKPDDGSPMIGCDDCDDWYHWPCVGISSEPPKEAQWFCPKCANKKKDKKHKKRKHKAH